MKRSASLVVVMFLPVLLAFGPSSCGPNARSPIKWPDVVQCAGDPVELVGDVTSILYADGTAKDISGASKQKLEDLAREKGASAVLCIVDRLVRDWIAPASTPEPHRIEAAARGESFLRGVGTKVTRL